MDEKLSLLMAMVLGDGCIVKQRKIIKEKTYEYANFEVSHCEKQKDYLIWKAKICREITGRKCRIRVKNVKERCIGNNKKPTPASIAYRFTCCHDFFMNLYKIIYKNGRKVFSEEYLKYLTPKGLAIWYMDDGNTYIDKRCEKSFSCELSTHLPLNEAEELIEYFKKYWNITFHLHKKAEEQYNLRCWSDTAYKFLCIIKPYVPECMKYKIIYPEYYNQERTTSHEDDEVL